MEDESAIKPVVPVVKSVDLGLYQLNEKKATIMFVTLVVLSFKVAAAVCEGIAYGASDLNDASPSLREHQLASLIIAAINGLIIVLLLIVMAVLGKRMNVMEVGPVDVYLGHRTRFVRVSALVMGLSSLLALSQLGLDIYEVSVCNCALSTLFTTFAVLNVCGDGVIWLMLLALQRGKPKKEHLIFLPLDEEGEVRWDKLHQHLVLATEKRASRRGQTQ